MTQVVADAVTNLIASFNFRRAISLVVILLIVGTAAWTVDYYTDFTRTSRLEKSTALLERLQAFEGKSLSPELETVRSQVAKELAELTAPPPVTVSHADTNPLREWVGRHWKKFLAGALPWFFFSLFTLPGALKGETAALGGFFAFQLLTVFFGVVVAVIPPIGSWFVDYLLIPGGLFMFVAVLPVAVASTSAIKTFKKVRETSKQKVILNNLRMLSAASDQYFLENGVTEVLLDQLIGPDKFIKALNPIEGETYPDIIRQGEPLAAKRPSGETMTYG